MSPPGDWRRVAALADLPEGTPHGVSLPRPDLPDLRLVLLRQGDAVHAFLDRCPHRGAAFSDVGFCDDEGHLICGWHFWAFDVATGGHTHIESIRLKRYPVRRVGDAVEVDVGAHG